jgi:hypothetical protein
MLALGGNWVIAVIRDLMGSTIAANDSQCTPRFVAIEHEKPIPDRYPS